MANIFKAFKEAFAPTDTKGKKSEDDKSEDESKKPEEQKDGKSEEDKKTDDKEPTDGEQPKEGDDAKDGDQTDKAKDGDQNPGEQQPKEKDDGKKSEDSDGKTKTGNEKEATIAEFKKLVEEDPEILSEVASSFIKEYLPAHPVLTRTLVTSGATLKPRTEVKYADTLTGDIIAKKKMESVVKKTLGGDWDAALGGEFPRYRQIVCYKGTDQELSEKEMKALGITLPAPGPDGPDSDDAQQAS